MDDLSPGARERKNQKWYNRIIILVYPVRNKFLTWLTRMIFGVILVAIGIIFLLQNLNIITGDAWKIIWPIVVILIGIGFILSRQRRLRDQNQSNRRRLFQERTGHFEQENGKWDKEE